MFYLHVAFDKYKEYDEYKEHQEDIGRPVLDMRDWLTKSDELNEFHRQYNHGKITASDLDCQATWELEYLLGA